MYVCMYVCMYVIESKKKIIIILILIIIMPCNIFTVLERNTNCNSSRIFDSVTICARADHDNLSLILFDCIEYSINNIGLVGPKVFAIGKCAL
jgi:hypothetical protein